MIKYIAKSDSEFTNKQNYIILEIVNWFICIIVNW